MDMILPPSWQARLAKELDQPYFKQLTDFVDAEYQQYTVYPPRELVFNAFHYCAFDDLKVVILGQDPYHGAGQANGLCFSVNDGIKQPPSLKNIFKEIHADTGTLIPDSGNLERWAKQGVLLLNSILTVRESEPASHKNKGWEQFTDAVIQVINEQKQQIVFILWGNYAQQKGKIVNKNQHLVLKSAHPSPFSVKKFMDNHHFSQTNQYLQQVGKTPILW
ncbi:uracil-DNA glycosylase [Candidatus Albibeggiatoa sp. nov. NOAA]|uniref:uracil-DNA glycosylase n=1 Tax=Candidatus Albibeggiatoa sp. nov. NOAA TaxID=3162724 RepID=UPI0032F0FABC|nr:uracil-DNA glycosylase [Thiotrichaceae bacterium]